MSRLAVIAIFALMLLHTQPAWSVLDISVTGGGWSPSIGVGDLQAGAGSDLVSTYQSVANLVGISISGAAGVNDSWRIDVRRTDVMWGNRLTLFLQRTGTGIGSGSVTGGNTFQAITDTDATFLSGAGDLSNIPVQLQLQGVSLQVPPNAYLTTITYTVVDL